MGLIEDYFKLTSTLKEKHGDKSVILMQNGAFYEIYGLKKENDIVGSSILDLSKLCDLHIADKKLVIDKMDVVQAGFGIREHIMEKYLKKMLDGGYIVSVWEQSDSTTTGAANPGLVGGITRKETGLYSPGTYFSENTNNISNNLLCVWLYKYKSNIVIGTSNIDIYTGKSSIYEYSTQYSKSPNTYNDLERLVSVYNPSEVIIIHNLENKEIDDVIQYMSFNTNSIRKINRMEEGIDSVQVSNCEKQTYQKEILRTFFYDNVYRIENEFMLYETATCSYCYLLNFISTHNPNLIKKISLPIFENSGSKLLLGNHSLKQLNILDCGYGSGRIASIERFLNVCLTAIGRRRFTHIIVNPITETRILNKEYDIIGYCIDQKVIQTILREKLTVIKDLEKLNRKMILKKITPYDFYILHSNLNDIIHLYADLSTYDELRMYFNNDTLHDHCSHMIYEMDKVLNIPICKNIGSYGEFDENFINKGFNTTHDKTVENMVDSYDKLVCISDYLNTELLKCEKSKARCVKIHQTEKIGCSLTLTKRRGEILKKITSKVKTPVTLTYYSTYLKENQEFALDCSSIQYIDSTKSDANITSGEIKELCILIQQSKHIMSKSLMQVYSGFVDKMADFSDNLDNICEFVGICDVLFAKVYIACKHNYCKPIIDNDRESSFMNVDGLRHPLIENLLQDELYITNDVSMNDEQLGILLYGTNAVGKSSFIKSIGITVIMAQAGMFVPCSSMVYKPYQSIFTRILGNDNLFKGLSTFAVEMLELKSIIRSCDENTLILGDELCSGTETNSAVSIFIAGLNHMYKKSSNFIFATHFHEIVYYDEIREKNQMAIKHMEVIYDKGTDSLVYNRKLQDGPGNNMYGLEVCKSLHLPDDFLDEAYSIRNKYSGNATNVLDLKTSHFNSKKLIGMCELCEKNMSSEVHHLQHQKDANNTNGYINNFHKNHVANLMSVCDSCHHKLHSDKDVTGHVRLTTTGGTVIETL